MAVTGSIASIAEALQWKLTQFALPDGVKLYLQGYDQPATGRYLVSTFFPNQSFAPNIQFDDIAVHYGLFQVSVYWDAGCGIVEPSQVADAVMVHFHRGSVIYRNGVVVRIEEQPFVSSPIVEPSRLQIPVTIPWVCRPANI